MFEIPVAERLGLAPEEILRSLEERYRASGSSASPRATSVSADLVADVHLALDGIPQRVTDQLSSRLLGVFFVAGLDSAAATELVTYANGDILGAVVLIDVEAISERTGNEWATLLENSAFHPSEDFTLEVRIAEPPFDCRSAAIQFILLRELGHVMASASDVMPDWWVDQSFSQVSELKAFPPLTWTLGANGVVPAEGNDFPLRSLITGEAAQGFPANRSFEVYDALSQTGFPTLYATLSMHEDFAETFATYVHCVLLGKPYEVRVRLGDEERVYADFWFSPNAQAKSAFFKDFLAQPGTAFPRRPHYAATAALCREVVARASHEFLGLAPFLRLSIAGGDLCYVAQELLAKANTEQENSILWMNLSTAFFSLCDRPVGLAIQEQALSGQMQFHLCANQDRTDVRILMLVAPGDLGQNTPLDCLLEGAPVKLNLAYCTPETPLPANLPEHDVLVVGLADNLEHRPTLEKLEHLLASWEKPVVNLPQFIPNVERVTASLILQGIPRLQMPFTHELDRTTLGAILSAEILLPELLPDCVFPIIIRPLGSHAGRGLQKIDSLQGLQSYLEVQPEDQFYISPFIDYSGEDGQFRKIRVAIIDGTPYVGHMAISSNWMIHYVNAGMYVKPSKAEEEAAFMDHFSDFVARHREALDAIYHRIGLDYLCIDCAETRDGQLLIFEVDHTMVVHAMDPVDLFPYKQFHMKKVQDAYVRYLQKLSARHFQAA